MAAQKQVLVMSRRPLRRLQQSGISAGAFQLPVSVVPLGDSVFCHVAAWALGEGWLWAMRLQLPWGFTSLHTTAANSLCQENSPVPHLSQSFLFQVVCILEILLVLKEKQ